MDRVDQTTRSRIMKSVPQRDTTPEKKLATALHARGFRYRKSPKSVPGKPDLLLTKYRAAIFVHGCFWHRHGCDRMTTPKSNTAYWMPKLEANKERDARKSRELRELGWRVATVWECGISGVPDSKFVELLDDLEAWLLENRVETELPYP